MRPFSRPTRTGFSAKAMPNLPPGDDHPQPCRLDETRPDAAFRVIGDSSYLYFVPRGRHLVVTFDNLATIDEAYPRRPWLARVADSMGWSILGVQSQAKDWFRQPEAPAFLRALFDGGFFRAFDSVVLTGASMGGFAALNFAPLIEGATVLAFSPQSTMSKDIAPFETRFPWAVRNSNWTDVPFLDAAAAVPYVRRAALVYDPFVPEDRAHALRLSAPHIQHICVDHSSHEAVRIILKSGAVAPMLVDMAQNGRVGPQVWAMLRARRAQRKWCRALLAAAEHRHPKLALSAARAMVARGNYLFALQAIDRLSDPAGDKAGKDLR